MVVEILNQILGIPREFLSNFIPLPEIGPFISFEYAGFIFFGFLLFTLLLARFLRIKNLITLIIITSAIGLVFGGIYLALVSFVVLLPLSLILKIKKGEGEEMPKEKLEMHEEEFKISETKMPEMEETKIPEEKPQLQKRFCPYCNNPLTYIPQYQRYYCYTCRRYI